jgi:hypothetical protein
LALEAIEGPPFSIELQRGGEKISGHVVDAVGGGVVLVVDPSWPRRPDIIQPERGGISRKRF